ncbi:hypothetical protein AXG93_1660s1320 [Marchantia polymorpha subsp. ruderalis]|uniref:Uncharacterized protein n=1 Tax=Marchantia polymorpha subsp. ruderalis TaxID=1480154 RepID=A0A176VSG3_MARPO|nr:hypothetical protein AXG93_1660s1320 [Marchantia polymorpha subsp. ruderalis]
MPRLYQGSETCKHGTASIHGHGEAAEDIVAIGRAQWAMARASHVVDVAWARRALCPMEGTPEFGELIKLGLAMGHMERCPKP